MIARILYADGTSEGVCPQNGRVFQLKELQKIVGGLIQIVYCNDAKHLLIVNEEGKLYSHKRNEQATRLASKSLHPEDYIAGVALHCRTRQIK